MSSEAADRAREIATRSLNIFLNNLFAYTIIVTTCSNDVSTLRLDP